MPKLGLDADMVPKVDLITVAYQKPDLLQQYLDDLAEHEAYRDMRVIVVDVASKNRRAPNCAFSQIYIPVHKANYSQAVNVGLRESAAEYIIWGNEDLRIHGPFVDAFLAPIKEDPKTLVGRVMGYQAGWRYMPAWLIGMHRNALEEIGYLDEDFPGTFEDVDYCVRATKAGYRLVKANVAVNHLALGRLNKYLHQGLGLLRKKHGNGPGKVKK